MTGTCAWIGKDGGHCADADPLPGSAPWLERFCRHRPVDAGTVTDDLLRIPAVPKRRGGPTGGQCLGESEQAVTSGIDRRQATHPDSVSTPSDPRSALWTTRLAPAL